MVQSVLFIGGSQAEKCLVPCYSLEQAGLAAGRVTDNHESQSLGRLGDQRGTERSKTAAAGIGLGLCSLGLLVALG
jgi:hypothetical protein